MKDLKINYADDIVSEFDTMIFELQKYRQLIKDQLILNEKLHNCAIKPQILDMWGRGCRNLQELHEVYSGKKKLIRDDI